MAGIFRYGRILIAISLAGILSSCLTKREEIGEVRTRMSFDPAFWGGKEGESANDEKEIRSKFADAGWKVDKDGNITGARNSDLFSNKRVDRGQSFDKREARINSRQAEKEVFQTPEYLERQKFRTKSADQGNLVARESNFDDNRAGESSREARESSGDSPGFLKRMNPFRKDPASESGKTFETSSDPEVARAQRGATVADGAEAPRDGDIQKAAMSVDDVRKLLHPEAFD